MKESRDQHLGILLDIQKQLGDLKAETKGQSEMLHSLNDKVALANSKTAKNVMDIQAIKDERNIEKGKLYVIMAIGGFAFSIVASVIVSFTKSKLGY